MTPYSDHPHQPGSVYKFHKFIYGPRHSSRWWFQKFSTVFNSLVFPPTYRDSVLFVRCASVVRIMLSLYADNMIISGDDCDDI